MKEKYRFTIYASYFGYITQAVVNNLAPLLFVIFQKSFSIPIQKITLLITINFLVQLLVDLLATKYVDRIGYRKCIVAAHIFAAVGLAGLAVFPHMMWDSYAGILLAVFLYAIGGGLIEVLVSPIVEACPTDNKASVMSLLHSFYCWGTVGVILLSTLFLKLAGNDSWPVLAVLWALLPLGNAVLFACVPIVRLTEEHESMSLKELFSMKQCWLFVVLMLMAGSSEHAMSQWASTFAESALGISKTLGDLAGPCMFAVLMGLSRVFYGKFGEKINLVSFLFGSALLCVSSYLIAAFSGSSVLALAGCGICGLSVGIMWPGVLSMASAAFPKGGTALFALLALAGDAGCSGGPTVVGMLAGTADGDLKKGLAVAVVFPMALSVCIMLYKKRRG